ncbi:uncharacterized protein LOC128951926 [Oppia nitens]|uniref:uncharacterized protein LOC128951926 n=1 Tax=Oppia nitens TaxID=1686743 RepID=UPI0023DB1F40|nr:uncharacterized protein LOC128951926 [Oppia nitens]
MSNENINYHYDDKIIEGRNANYRLHPLILSRTSLREMSGEPVERYELLALFESGRWAPSFHNLQPWRFVYALNGTEHWSKFFNLLWPRNQLWVQRAGALVVVISHRNYRYRSDPLVVQDNPTHSFDTGAACMSMALEATARDQVLHAMAGFDYDRTYDVLGIDRSVDRVECMLAIGKRLASDQRREERIAPRFSLTDSVFEGNYNITNQNDIKDDSKKH